MATADKLTTIAENVPKVYHAGQMNVVQSAQSLKGSESNTAMLIDDISPVTHEMGVKVRGKNLFDKDNANILTAYFTASGDVLNTNARSTRSIWIPCSPNTTYTVSKMASARFAVGFTNEEPMNGVTVNNVTFLPTATEITVTSNNNDKYIIVWFYHSSYDTSVTVEEILASMQIELGTTATAYTPYIPDLTAVKVSRYGKNLFDYSGVNFVKNAPNTVVKENNGFTFNALAASSAYFHTTKISAFNLKPNTKYTSRAIVTLVNNGSSNIYESASMGLSLLLQTNSTFDSSGKGKVYIVNGYQNGNGVYSEVGTHEIITTFTTPSDMTDFKYIVTRVANKTTVIFKDLQIQLGDTSSEYEPYIAPTEYTPTADGTVEGVTSLYPNTTLITNTDGVIIDCEYYKDIDKAYNKLSAAIALSGGK